MSLLSPLALLFGLLAGPIVLMYMLRLRRPAVRVSSTLLWQQLARDREANAPWQKLKRNLLLILQLLILAALALALARPYLRVPSVVNTSVVVLLDASASMQASDVSPTRFAIAQQEVEQIINSLGSNQMTLIQVGRTPQVLASATNDKTRLREALAAAQPDNTTADWTAAFALALGAVQGYQEAQVVILSDGGLPSGLPPLPAASTYIPIGTSGENLALTALATRPTAAGIQLFASVANHGRIPQQVLLSLTIDGVLYDAQQVDVPAGGQTSRTWDLADEAAVIQASLSNAQFDYLPLDDTATTVHEGGIRNRALIVTEGNRFLEQIFAVLPGLEPFIAAPDSPLLQPTAEPFDLYVFDGVPLPNPLPAADLLLINPSQSELVNVTGVVTGTAQTAAIRLTNSPLLQFVDWGNIAILQMKQVEAPWAQTLVQAEGGPLVLAGERAGQRIAILSFKLQDSDLPLQITFPILMANLTSWLNPGKAFSAPEGMRPHEVVTIIPSATATAVRILLPDGTTWEEELGEAELLFNQTGQLGRYDLFLMEGDVAQPAGSFAVNLFAAEESAIAPQENIFVGAGDVPTPSQENVGQWEFWPWLAAVAFLILLLEWWVYHRGLRWPQVWVRSEK